MKWQERVINPPSRLLFIAGLLISGSSMSVFSSPQDSLVTDYEKGLNSDTWRGGIHVQKPISKAYGFVLSEDFSSSRLVVPQGEDKWRDQNELTLVFDRRFRYGLSCTVSGSSVYFSDKQSGYVNDIQTQLIGAGAAFQNAWMRMPIFIGYKEDSRYGQKDGGVHFKAGWEGARTVGGTMNRLFGAYEIDDLGKRMNTTLSASYLLSREFQKGTYDTLQLGLSDLRRDYYISEYGDIESREEKGQSVGNVLSYRLWEGLSCWFQGGVRTRTLTIRSMETGSSDIRRERKDLSTTGAMKVLVNRRRIKGQLSFLYSWEEQKYTISEEVPSSPYSGSGLFTAPDNRFSYATLSCQAAWEITASDILNLFGSMQRFRYDTPDPENFDDRDELRMRLILQAVHRMTPHLALGVQVSTHHLHYVYIFGEKSADNNWTRILRLAPTLAWQPSPRFRLSQSAEVMANYVDYDYETLFPSTRSFLYRQFRLEDSTWVHLSARSSVFLYYRLELDENGKLSWDEWAEQRLVDRQSHTLVLSLDFQPWNGFHIAPGIMYYSRKGYQYKPGTGDEKALSIDFESFGPSIKMQLETGRVRFLAAASLTHTSTLESQQQNLTRIDLRMSCAL